MDNTTLRKENQSDYAHIESLIQKAFEKIEFSAQREHLLVARLRNSPAFIPELSIVAELNGQILGHILLTKIKIKNEHTVHESLALAPVSVLPKFQNKGIGSQLIQESHRVARSLGYKSIILLGHEDYYPRFGYLPTSQYNIKLPFEAPEENCMALELTTNSLQNVYGTVEYPSAFFE